jgi:amidase
MRGQIVGVAVWCALAASGHALLAQAERPVCRIDVVDATIPELQSAMADGRANSIGLVDAYLARIAAYDQRGPRLNAVIRVNPRARVEAAARDAERRSGHVRGALHGIPVLVKDNYDTKDLATTAGSIALAEWIPPDDAVQVQKLREAGAVILGKTNMHELASGITTISSSGGQTLNPYDLARIPGGSSGGSGAAAAASFAAITYGSDTCGSIRIPAAYNDLFGLRPTKGLTSITGIVPLAHTQDVAGPLARTVIDLAIGLDATIGEDAADSATRILEGRPLPHFVAQLDTASLRGVRLGVLRSYLGDQPEDREVSRVVRAALDQMAARGAQLIDVDLPVTDSLVFKADVTNYEFKFDFMDYLAARRGSPVRSLTEILDHGQYDVALDQALHRRDSTRTRDSDDYRAALGRRDVVRQALLSLLDGQHLDALVYPTMRHVPPVIGEPVGGASCLLASVTGMPAISVPAGFTRRGLPVGLELLGRQLDDARLVSFAYAYEQRAHPRRRPPTTPPLIRGKPPAPTTYVAVVRSRTTPALSARADFRFDALTGVLQYAIRISAGSAPDVIAATLSRGTAEQPGPILHRLMSAGTAEATGTLQLRGDERADLLAGRMYFTLYTRGERAGVRTVLASGQRSEHRGAIPRRNDN